MFMVFFGLGVLAWLVALAKLFWQPAPPPIAKEADPGRWVALALVIFSGVLAWFVGASRGPEHDWDLYNYISMVRKFLVWGMAGTHHYFYADAPPDPIHSYNLHALVWAVIALKNRVDPIPLYIHSAFLTVPLCFAAFFSLARRSLGNRAGFFAFAFYFFFQIIYGGMYFVGNSTFYPDDAIWLLGFPALLSLAFIYLEKAGGWAALLTAFSALAVSVIHPLWGLAFYMVFGFLLAAESKFGSSMLKEARTAQKEQKTKSPLVSFDGGIGRPSIPDERGLYRGQDSAKPPALVQAAGPGFCVGQTLDLRRNLHPGAVYDPAIDFRPGKRSRGISRQANSTKEAISGAAWWLFLCHWQLRFLMLICAGG